MGTQGSSSPLPKAHRLANGAPGWPTSQPEVSLQRWVDRLEKINAEFLRAQQQLEQEFNQKRAKFKELYLAKEGKCMSSLKPHTETGLKNVRFLCSTVLSLNKP